MHMSSGNLKLVIINNVVTLQIVLHSGAQITYRVALKIVTLCILSVGNMRNSYKIVSANFKRLFESLNHGREDNTNTDLRKLGFEGVHLVQLTQDGIQW
jgi:hypothetical protein